MNFEIKTGDDLTCEYTKEKARVLVRYLSDGQVISLWMGKKALEQAIGVIKALDGSAYEPFPMQPLTPWIQPTPDLIPAPYQPIITSDGTTTTITGENLPITPTLGYSAPASKAQPVDTEKHLREELERNLASVIEGSRDDKGRINGSPINEFLKGFLPRFKNPKKNAFPVVNKMLPQINAERFENLI